MNHLELSKSLTREIRILYNGAVVQWLARSLITRCGLDGNLVKSITIGYRKYNNREVDVDSECVSSLHRSANLILNLFSLMVDANIPDIALEPDKTVKKVNASL